MRKKVMILVLAGILTVGGISLAYAASNNDKGANNLNRQMMTVQNSEGKSSMMGLAGSGAQPSDNYNKMIEIMKENGFADEATAMENKDFDTMKKLMSNISDADYQKMIDAMKNNGYESMANRMQSVGKDNMMKFHQSMIGK